MCILYLKSTNVDLGWIIGKNPATPMVIKSLRQGKAFGYYDATDPQKYVVYFEDGKNKMSYKEDSHQSYEYCNNLKYTSPLFPVNAINEFFSYATKEQRDKDIVAENEFYCSMIQMNGYVSKLIKKLALYFKINIQIDQVAQQSYEMKFSGLTTLHHIINVAYVIMSYISIMNRNDLFIDNPFINKIANAINSVSAPYYIRYILSSRTLNLSQFKSCKTALESHPESKITLHFGNTELHRKCLIEKYLNFDNDIIDIGCGEGFYVSHYAPKAEEMGYKYHAVDVDKEELDKAKKKAAKLGLTKTNFYDSVSCMLKEVDCDLPYDVIMTEVVEHMEMCDSIPIIQSILDKVNYKKIIITTPNVEFNKNYIMDTKFRHHDHKFELTTQEFTYYMNRVTDSYDVTVTYVPVGDIVDNICCSHGAIIRKQTSMLFSHPKKLIN